MGHVAFCPCSAWPDHTALPLLRRWLLVVLALACGLGGHNSSAGDAQRMAQAAQQLGPGAVAALPSLQALLQYSAELDEVGQLAAVNNYFNHRIVFAEDQEVWSVSDYWASPLELLQQGRGDCEDYAIAKYFSLLALGMPPVRLRMVYVKAHIGTHGQPHMVLAYYAQPHADPLILDFLITTLLPAAQRRDLTPVFSFNSEGLWQGVGAQRIGGPQGRLSRWHEVQAKAQAEGFL
jgi:predicted transglutaminase-like cysteine proteinase